MTLKIRDGYSPRKLPKEITVTDWMNAHELALPLLRDRPHLTAFLFDSGGAFLGSFYWQHGRMRYAVVGGPGIVR